jgi:hypothetical protein
MQVVLASMTGRRATEGVAVQRGLRSLLRRTGSSEDGRRFASACTCGLLAFLLAPAAAWGQPTPDPPPPGERGSQPTNLKPDTRPGAAEAAPPAPPAPRQETVAPVAEPPAPPAVATQPQAVRPAPRAVPATTRPAGRAFAPSQKPARRAVPQPERARPAVALPILSTDSNTHAYVIAALSLAVLALGSGTLVTVLTRLRSTRQGLV